MRTFPVESGITKGIAMAFSRMGLSALALGALVLAGGGCQNKLHDENVALWQQNRELQSRLSESQSQPKAAPTTADSAQLASLQQQLADRDAKIAELQN